jgi:hypothetical protein
MHYLNFGQTVLHTIDTDLLSSECTLTHTNSTPAEYINRYNISTHTIYQPIQYINRYNIQKSKSINIRIHVSYNLPEFIYKNLYGTQYIQI